MGVMSDRPKRRRPSRNEIIEIRGRPNILFVTVAARVREPVFIGESIHKALRDAWSVADFWRVGRYVIMPDHIHFFCATGRIPPPALRPWVKYWKRLVTQAGVFPRDDAVWLPDCWDTQMRDRKHYAEKWAYVRENPVRGGLVDRAEDWPWAGELNALNWH
jgi:REP element-mobilizing transposase RayT